MPTKKVIYFDSVYDEFKDLFIEHTPEGFEVWFWHEMNEIEKNKKIQLADYLIVAAQPFGADIISRAKNAKLIQKTGIGIDNIDIQAAERCGIPVCNTVGANATGVAELTILLILALYRQLPLVNGETKNGKWLMWELRPSSYEMHGKVHGFIGFGHIGREVATRSKAFGTKIIYYDKFKLTDEQERDLGATYVSLEEIITQSDIISLHVPLLPETRQLLGEKQFKMMKESAILINVARGGVVNEVALFDALKSKQIAGAGIDVWEREPTNPQNPLFSLENVIATPHIAAGTRDTFSRVVKKAFANIERVEQGKLPIDIVNNVKEARVIM